MDKYVYMRRIKSKYQPHNHSNSGEIEANKTSNKKSVSALKRSCPLCSLKEEKKMKTSHLNMMTLNLSIV